MQNENEQTEYESTMCENIDNLADTQKTVHFVELMNSVRAEKKLVDKHEFEALRHQVMLLTMHITRGMGDPIPNVSAPPIAFVRRQRNDTDNELIEHNKLLEQNKKLMETQTELLEQNHKLLETQVELEQKHKLLENRVELLEDKDKAKLTTTPQQDVVVNLTEEVLVTNLVNSLPPAAAPRCAAAPDSYTPDEVSKMTDAELIKQFTRITGCTQLNAKNRNPTNLIFWVDAIRARCVEQHAKGGGKGLHTAMPLPKTPDANLHQNIKTNDENNRAFGLLRKAYVLNDQQTINIVQQRRSQELAKIGVLTNPYKYKIVVG